MAMSSLSVEEENYVRMSLLLTGLSTRAVRALFDREFPPTHLPSTLKQEYNKLLSLQKSKVITQAQWILLFPPQPGVADSKTFDVTLMICLIRNLTSVKEPACGFDRLPSTSDTTPGADIARIKYYRNYLAHSDDNKINNSDFSNAWNDISDAVKRLGGSAFYIECQDLKTKILDQSNQEIMLEIRKCKEEVKKNEEKVTHQFKELSRKYEEMEQDMAQMMADLECKQKESEILKTKFYEEIKMLKTGAEKIKQSIAKQKLKAKEVEKLKANHEQMGELIEIVKSDEKKTKELTIEIEKLKADLEEIKKEFENLKETVPWKIRDFITKADIQTESSTFVETKVVEDGVEFLEKNGIVLLSGISGIGKTTNAKEIIKRYCKLHNHYEMHVPKLHSKGEMEENMLFSVGNKYKVILVDDFLDSENEFLMKEDMMWLERIHRHLETVKVVMTARDSTLKFYETLFQRNIILSNIPIIDLNANSYKMNEQEMAQMFKVSCPTGDLSFQTVPTDMFDEHQGHIGFPKLCQMFSDSSLRDCKLSYTAYFENLKTGKVLGDNDYIYYATLVYIMMFGKLFIDCNDPSLLPKEIMWIQKILNVLSSQSSDLQTLELLDSYKDGVLKKEEGMEFMYFIENKVVHDDLFSSYASFGLTTILPTLSIEFISRFLLPCKFEQRQNEKYIFVDVGSYAAVASRVIGVLCEDTLNGRIRITSVSKLRVSLLVQDETFLQILLEHSAELESFEEEDTQVSQRSTFFLPIVLLQFIARIANIQILVVLTNYIKNKIESKPNEGVMRACKQRLVLAVNEVCNEDNVQALDILRSLIDEFDSIDYSQNNFLNNAMKSRNEKTLRWIFQKIDGKYLHLKQCLVKCALESAHDDFKWMLQVMKEENMKDVDLHALIVDISMINTELSHFLWEQYEEDIIQSYIDNKKSQNSDTKKGNERELAVRGIMDGVLKSQLFESSTKEAISWLLKTFVPNEKYFKGCKYKIYGLEL